MISFFVTQECIDFTGWDKVFEWAEDKYGFDRRKIYWQKYDKYKNLYYITQW